MNDGGPYSGTAEFYKRIAGPLSGLPGVVNLVYEQDDLVSDVGPVGQLADFEIAGLRRIFSVVLGYTQTDDLVTR